MAASDENKGYEEKPAPLMQVLWIYYVSTAFLGLSSHLMYNSVASIPKIVLYTLEILRLRKRNIVSWPAIKTQHKGTKENPYHTLIIGAGFSGIGMAKRLKEEGMHDFVIVERGDDIGGTWYFNTYPNCACDVPSYMYSFSWEQNPDWSHYYGRQKEIWEYLKHCVGKYSIQPHIKLEHEVTATKWLQDDQVWRIETTRGVFHSRFFVNGQGFISDPRLNFAGKEEFKGHLFHSAQWDHEYDLTGKRVAVIGTGASAIQFVPGIVNKAKEVIIFQRSAPYIITRDDFEIPKWCKTLLRYVPGLLKLARGCIYWTHEAYILGFLYRYPTEKILQIMLTYYRKCQIKDPELLKAVTPNYTVGCKRVMISNDWYPAIARKNVRVVPRPVKTLCEDGLIADDGTHVPCDVVILGTGFETQRLDFHSGFDIEGKDGVKLFDFWQREGAMKAYKGITIPHLPNYFVTMGPNTNLSHNSVVYMIEHQIEYIIQAMKYAQVNNKKTIEVKRKPFDEFNEGQQESLKRSVWNNGGCTSWYLDGTKHNTSIWGLGFTFRYRNATKNFDPEAYTIV